MALEVKKDEGKALVVLDSDLPSDLKANKSTKKVLDEEKYTEGLEKIIVRDFFPDLPEMKERQEYLEALQRNDTEKLRALHLKYSKRTPGTGRPGSILPTPSVFETPIEKPAQNFQAPKSQVDPTGQNPDEPVDKERPTHNPEPKSIKIPKDDTKLPLDKFLAKNTSEDNASFVEIMEESEKKHRLKHAWLFDQEKEEEKNYQERLALPSVEKQAIMDSTHKVDTWTYKAKNAVMYIPEGITTTPEEHMKLKAKGGRQIVHKNTRFTSNPFNVADSQRSMKEAANTQSALLMGKVGVDGKEVLPKATPRVNGYGFVNTPTPAPGVEDTPLMTWGEIEGTPFGLDGGSTPMFRPTPGPQFKIPDVPHRDRIGLELAEKASKAHRDKKNEAIKRVQRNMTSPSPKFGSSKTDRLTGLSPAAQRLASGRLGIAMGTDKALASSYTPSPLQRRDTDKTPTVLTTPSPLGGLRKTPKQTTKRPSTGGPSLTDNLLILPKRNK